VTDLASPLIKARRIIEERIDHLPIAIPQRVMIAALERIPPNPSRSREYRHTNQTKRATFDNFSLAVSFSLAPRLCRFYP
jgi:hypothetical protein